MSVHYDTIEMAARIRSRLAEQKLPENPEPHMLVKVRNGGETQVAAMIMFFAELNRGTEPLVVVAAMASIVTEWLTNVASGWPEEVRAKVYMAFQRDLARMSASVLQGEYFSAAEAVNVSAEKGGHA